MLLFIIRGKGENPNIDRSIKELTNIAEMSLSIGLFLLTIGNFLGGIWANESWGRYWGWDAKETWAAVTILIYATVLHLRFIPKLNNAFAFNVASLWAYSSVIMTYFGVNYYLSGLHSYAAGAPVPIPNWVPYSIIVLAILTFFAYRNRKMK
jgi:ABC-type transport system involved in cytochrome c biogenesis permease subunit